MANDLRLNLRLNAEDFDKNLSKSKKQIDSWRKNTDNQSNQIRSSFSGVTKMAGKMFAAVMAFDTIKNFGKNIIDSSQKTGDAFANNINAAKTSYEAFCAALANSDFSAFEDGLLGVFERAKELSALLDSIADAQKAVSYSGSKNAVELQRNENIVKDKSKSKEERQAALDRNIEIINTEGKDRLRIADENRNAAMLNAGIQGITGLTKDDVDLYLRELNNDFVNSKFVEQLKALQEYSAEYDKAKSKLISAQVDGVDFKKQAKFNSQYKRKEDFLKDTYGEDAMFNGDANKMLAFGKLYNQGDKGRDILYNAFTAYEKELLWVEQSAGTIVGLQNRINAIKSESSNGSGNVKNLDTQSSVNYTRDQLDEAQRFAGLGRLKEQGKAMLEEAKAIKDKVNTEFNQIGAGIEIPDDLNRWQQEKIDLLNQQREAQEALNDSMFLGSELESMLFGSNTISKGLQVLALYDTLGAALQKLDGLKEVSAANDNAIADQKVAANEKETASAMTAFSAQLMKWFAFAGPFAPVLAMGVSMAAMAGLGQIVGMIPKFATGGIVGGGSVSGDKIPALLNSGEMVLNDRQQTALFNQLDRGNSGNGLSGQVEFIIKGDYLKGILNKTNRRDSRV